MKSPKAVLNDVKMRQVAQPQPLFEVSIKILNNGQMLINHPDLTNNGQKAAVISALLQAANTIVNKYVAPDEEQRIVQAPPGLIKLQG